jgi:hypothetical protein
MAQSNTPPAGEIRWDDKPDPALIQWDTAPAAPAKRVVTSANLTPMDTLRNLRDTLAGGIRGAASIGSTILELGRTGNPQLGGQDIRTLGQRQQARAGDVTSALQTLGADTESPSFQAGRLTTEVAGTMGTGGALAQGGARVAPAAMAAAQRVVPAIGQRVAGGALGGGAAAAMVDPNQAGTGAAIGAALPVVGQVVRGGATLGREMLGATTGVGGAAISQAVRAGKQGGRAAEDFTGAMRGQSSMDDVLAAAKGNLDVMRQSKQSAYRSGMADVSKDRTVLDFTGLDDALTDAAKQVTYRGVSGKSSPQVKSQTAALNIAKMSDEVEAWRKLDPAEFHTPEGFDALKQKLGDILESIPFEDKTARMVAGKIYNAAKSSIQAQAPTYAKVMGDYSKASGAMTEIERALSLGNKASADTSMRKLQSLMRNNANTSYGYRDDLARLMIDEGGNDIMPALAGQAMNSWVPRGIQRATAGGGAATLGMLGNIPAAAGLAAISSPRLVGEGAFMAGRALSPLEQLIGPAARAAPVLALDRN